MFIIVHHCSSLFIIVHLCSSMFIYVHLCSLFLLSLSHILTDGGQALAARDRACLSSTPWHDSKSSHWIPHEYSISKDCKAPKSIEIHYLEELDGFGMASGPKWKYTNTKALQLRDAAAEAPAIWPPGSDWDGMVEDVEAPRWIILLCRFLGFSRFSAAKSLCIDIYIYIICYILCVYNYIYIYYIQIIYIYIIYI